MFKNGIRYTFQESLNVGRVKRIASIKKNLATPPSIINNSAYPSVDAVTMATFPECRGIALRTNGELEKDRAIRSCCFKRLNRNFDVNIVKRSKVYFKVEQR